MRPRKSRGQNFLVQARLAERIVAAAQLVPNNRVVEIGPGLGILSDAIARHPLARLTLIELDPRLAAPLAARFVADSRIIVINEDFLRTDLKALAEDRKAVTDAHEFDDRRFKVIGNLPFNAAAAILERLCASRPLITRMVLMFQREVAERIRARPRTSQYGALSVYTALYWEVIDHFRVAAGNFHPRPKVDAEVLVFSPSADQLFASESEEQAILTTIRASFSTPRKTIRNSLATGLRLRLGVAEEALARVAIEPSARPGMLAVADFVRLARALGDAARPPDCRDA
ncbi:MAG TPA: 16S rRNA (adenine(1518)-N(6)/adenine(1519)-N(6))-dimethyltransferase RsmA [Candidatus Binataceae bacterium]|nr:16S rRNA (adenine(1518)-N(6)/adenine(1519)-N(6))-dimethyltransferase RsmA [Candidatus Binataceae bacterium]